jgi:hypothetical protein
MNKKSIYSIVFCLALFTSSPAIANFINANSLNYTSFLSLLTAGDTLNLASGTYVNNLTLNGRNGTLAQPIVIMGNGNSTNFQGQACCNTVSITQCSYVIIRNMQLDGLNQFVDAVKAEGTIGNWAHHITIEYLDIINYGFNQQSVGISTKCSAWDWVIRKNRIIGAGTGMYLGNSTGEAPFVNGLIEYNYVANTIGYNIEIKHQLDTVRDNFAGTSVNGKTIIRHNVFTKDSTSSTGGNARPNLLVGGFPLTGFGSIDYYEIYGNFFYNNPVEALFQGTGNIMLYENIFVNHFDPSGFRAVYISPQNGVSPQDIKVFHNTAWVLNSSGGIRLYNPDNAYQQYCYGNAVFAPSPITNFTNILDNITDNYSSAGNYVLSATTNIATLNLYPQAGQVTGTLTPNSLFLTNSDFEKDFNGDVYDWTYRGAYSGCCTNNGWQLQLDTMTTQSTTTSLVSFLIGNNFTIYPNPFTYQTTIAFSEEQKNTTITITDMLGKIIKTFTFTGRQLIIEKGEMKAGIYFVLTIDQKKNIFKRKIVIQ